MLCVTAGGQLNSSDVWRYMPQLDHWLRVAPLAQGRRLHAMAPLLGKVSAFTRASSGAP